MPTPPTSRNPSRNRRSKDVRSPGIPDSDSDSDFGDDGLRHPFQLDYTISLFPLPSDGSKQSIQSDSPTLDGHEDKRIGEDTLTDDANSGNHEESEGEKMKGIEVEKNAGLMLHSTLPSAAMPQDGLIVFPSIELKEKQYTMGEVRSGRMPSLTKRRYWHLPASYQPNETSTTEAEATRDHADNAKEPDAPANIVPNFSSKYNGKHDKNVLIKKAKSLGNIRRPRRNLNL